ACSVCARNKNSFRTRAGLLQPLPIPSRPWAEISVDFVTGLPTSNGNTAILTVVDRFSKMVHYIALPKLPSAKETAVVMMDSVFRIHGFPRDIVSDRGPQFVSRFWKEFCKLIGATASLTSRYHPEANGQTERLNQPPGPPLPPHLGSNSPGADQTGGQGQEGSRPQTETGSGLSARPASVARAQGTAPAGGVTQAGPMVRR
ncbi:transposase family protein, partial [Escherichia coli]|nr:transposase family protein [Escherichia coli]